MITEKEVGAIVDVKSLSCREVDKLRTVQIF